MYTEDDEKVTVKKDNSKNEYSDFYTSFSEIDKESSTKKDNKKKKDVNNDELKKEPKEEKDYSDFYISDGDKEEVVFDDGNKKSYFKIILAVVVFIILIILIIFLVSGKKVSGDIELSQKDITLNIGEKAYISYKVIDTESNVTSTFESSNNNIVIVDNNGGITALDAGDATITIHYTIDGVTRDKKCNVKVNNNGSVNTNVTLNLSGYVDAWVNKDVIINVDANSIFGINKLQYALNCDSDCNYQDVSNNQIVVTTPGTTKVKVIAKDGKNQEAIKDVVVKIDKEAPSATLNSSKNITSNKDVTVCATCNDNMSGCKQSSVCKTYTGTKTNQVITVEDVAGNKKNSDSFNVTINKTTAPCTLKVSADGTVTATLREEATYYGFNSNYSGNNTLSQKITINAYKKGESSAKVVYYYVKNKNGTGGRCFLTVIKTCRCKDKNSVDANCPVTCTFTSQ